MPTGLTASPISTSTIRLQWSDNSNNENGFLLNNQGSTRQAGANSSSYDWGGLPPGTFACFAVAAFNAAGYSSYYPTAAPGWICATTDQPDPSPSVPPPTAPSGLTATALNTTTIRLQWTDNSSTETGFEIANATGTSNNANAGATQYDWTGLTAGTNMCFHVRAYNDAGFSAFSPASATICATTPGPPAAPTNIVAYAITQNTIRVNWSYDWQLPYDTDNHTRRYCFNSLRRFRRFCLPLERP